MAGRAEAHGLWSTLSAEYERYKRAVEYIPTAELRLQEDLRKYLCLRCAGFLEQVTLVVLAAYVDLKSSGPINEFGKTSIPKVINLTSERFVNLISRFGESHNRAVTQFLTPARHEALSDLLEVRNPIAHGDVIGGRKLNPDRYITLCQEVHDWLVDTFLSDEVEERN